MEEGQNFSCKDSSLSGVDDHVTLLGVEEFVGQVKLSRASIDDCSQYKRHVSIYFNKEKVDCDFVITEFYLNSFVIQAPYSPFQRFSYFLFS